MRLLKLALRNFKGVRELTVDTAGGADVEIFGRNATGKTTIADAFFWLLFDKDSEGNAQFAIKTLASDGEALHNLEHSVDGVFDVDGTTMTMRKVMTEKWTKKRGSSNPEFTGHTTEYFIDGVPMQLKEYKCRVSNIATEEMFQLLTSPQYFAERLPWKERRRVLLDVCGEISDAEVIASDPRLAPLSSILPNNRSMDDHKKVVQASMAKINAEIKEIPARIDEVSRAMPQGVSHLVDVENEKRAIIDMKNAKAEAEAEYARIEAGGQSGDLRRRLVEADTAVAETESCHRIMVARLVEQAETGLAKSRTLLAALVAEEEKIKKDIAELAIKKIDTSEIDEEMAQLRREWSDENEKQYAFDGQRCPNCGFHIGEEDDAETIFEKKKKDRLVAINTKGLKLKAEKERRIGAFEQVKAHVAKKTEEAAEIASRIIELRAEIASADAKIADIVKAHDLADNEEYRKAMAAKEQAAAAIKKTQAGDHREELIYVGARIDRLAEGIAELEKVISEWERREDLLARVKELEARERWLGGEYERMAGELFLIDFFTRAKVSMLEEKINNKFSLARFKLFSSQINGGLSECCDVTFNGVPYSSGLNNGAKINVGLDIIKTLSVYYGKSFPVIIDNAESVNEIVAVDSQVIRLVVSDDDTLLVKTGTKQTTMEEAA